MKSVLEGISTGENWNERLSPTTFDGNNLQRGII